MRARLGFRATDQLASGLKRGLVAATNVRVFLYAHGVLRNEVKKFVGPAPRSKDAVIQWRAVAPRPKNAVIHFPVILDVEIGQTVARRSLGHGPFFQRFFFG